MKFLRWGLVAFVVTLGALASSADLDNLARFPANLSKGGVAEYLWMEELERRFEASQFEVIPSVRYFDRRRRELGEIDFVVVDTQSHEVVRLYEVKSGRGSSAGTSAKKARSKWLSHLKRGNVAHMTKGLTPAIEELQHRALAGKLQLVLVGPADAEAEFDEYLLYTSQEIGQIADSIRLKGRRKRSCRKQMRRQDRRRFKQNGLDRQADD